MSHGQNSFRHGSQVEQWMLENMQTFFSHIVVTLHDLRNPTPEMVSRVYGAFLEEIGVNITNLLQIQNNQMPLITHVDMFNVSVPLLNQHQCLSYFLKHIGVVIEFNLSDLVTPTPKRTLIFFERIIKFLEYCNDRIGSIQEDLEEISELVTQKEELLEKIEVLRNNLNQRASGRVARQEKLKQVNIAVDVEKERLNAVIVEKEQRVVAQNSIKKLMEEDAVKEDQLIQNLAQIGDDVNKLRETVVKSPERMKHFLDELSRKRADLRECVMNLKHQIEAKKHLNLVFSREKVKQEERIEKLEKLLTTTADVKEKEQKISELTKQYTTVLECCNEKKKEMSRKEEKKKTGAATVQELSISKKTQNKMDRDQLQRAEAELQDLTKRRKERIERVNRLNAEIEQVNKDIKQIQAQFTAYEKEKDALKAKHKLMEKSIAERYSNIMLELKQINANMKKN